MHSTSAAQCLKSQCHITWSCVLYSFESLVDKFVSLKESTKTVDIINENVTGIVSDME